MTALGPPAPRAEPARLTARSALARVSHSVAVGLPEAGSLVRGVRFPAEGNSFFTWDPIRHEQPNRTWRRWGTDDLVRTTLGVLRGFARDHPKAPRVGVGDLSVRGGGDFGPEVGGGIGHATHQNGLDVDVYYPLRRRSRARAAQRRRGRRRLGAGPGRPLRRRGSGRPSTSARTCR